MDPNTTGTNSNSPASPLPASTPSIVEPPQVVVPPTPPLASSAAPTTPPPSPVSPPVPSPVSAMPPATAPAQTPPKKNKSMLWVIFLLILAFICGLLIVVWYFQSQFQKVSPEMSVSPTPVVKITKLVVGTDATFQPMEYVASGEAEIVGYDIDLGNAISKELGVAIEYKNIPWDDIFKALDNQEIDMVISSVTITDERKAKYDFSDNYLNAGQVILTRKENTTISTAEDLQGKKIAVQEGTTNENEALKHTLETLVIRYPDFEQATKALVDGEVDAILSDLPGAKGIVTENSTLKIASDPLTNEYYGIAFRKNYPHVAKINEALLSLRTKGVLTDLKQKWLD